MLLVPVFGFTVCGFRVFGFGTLLLFNGFLILNGVFRILDVVLVFEVVRMDFGY